MFAPVLLYFIVFAYLPMSGIIVAFKSFNYRQGIYLSPWIGFDNFKFFFSSGKALSVTINTVAYNLVFLTCYTFFSILIAILIAEMFGKLYRKVAQTLLFLPYFMSWVVVAAFMYNFANYEFGLINSLLKALSLQPIDIYADPKYWYFILPFLYVWKWIGYGSVLYLAAIMGIDQECYEAAKIDGANIFKTIRYITLPSLRPTMVILILMGIGTVMRGQFDMFYQLIGNNGTLLDATDIIDTLVFRSLMGSQDFGMAASAGAYQSVLCFVIIVTVNAVVKRYEKDYALF